MSTRTGSRASSRSSQQQPAGPRWLRWVLTVMALVIASAAIRQQVLAQDAPPKPREECEDFTPDGRPCSVSEEIQYCIENAMDAYDRCLEDANWVEKIACTLLYDLDFYSCGLLSPIIKVLK